jgi:DNA-binding NarL/FixJ family response regulator
MQTTVALVEDNRSIRESLSRIIDQNPGFRCVCAVSSAEEALEKIPASHPDVVLMDIHLPGMSGIECTALLKKSRADIQVIMLTVYEDSDRIFKALKAGASGYLLKRTDPAQLLTAIKEIKEGGAPMTSEIARKVVEAFQTQDESTPQAESLSKREREILEMLCAGFANKEIADKLSLSIETVRGHLKHIYDKLHVQSRTQAVVKFLSSGKDNASPMTRLPRGF